MASVPDLIRQIATQMGQQAGMSGQTLQSFIYAALGSAYQESGFNPQAVGDNGSSFGLFQLHEGGELGSNSAQWAFDPTNNITRALTEFISVWRSNPSVAQNPGQWAALSQRPADEAGYASAVNGNVTRFSQGQIPIGPAVTSPQGAVGPAGGAPGAAAAGTGTTPWGSFGDYARQGFTTPAADTLSGAAAAPAPPPALQVVPTAPGGVDFNQIAQNYWDQQPHPQAPTVKVKDYPVAHKLATITKAGGHATPQEASSFWESYAPLLEAGITPSVYESMLGVMGPLSWAFHGRPPSFDEFIHMWDQKAGRMRPVSEITDFFKNLPDKHYPTVTAGAMAQMLSVASPFARMILGREPVKSEAAFFHHGSMSANAIQQHYTQIVQPHRSRTQSGDAVDTLQPKVAAPSPVPPPNTVGGRGNLTG